MNALWTVALRSAWNRRFVLSLTLLSIALATFLLLGIERVRGDAGVLLLTDMFGGTPSNLGMTFLESDRLEVITGVNLPMLIRLEGARKMMKIKAAVAAARDAGRKYISVASEVLGEAAA